jgi:Flp pilus assembly protein TadD
VVPADDEDLQAVYASSPYRNARPGVRYVGDQGCLPCHKDIATTYHRHPMGRSLEPVSRQGSPPPGHFEKLGFSFSALWQDGRMVHRAARRDGRGRTVAAEEAVRWVLGSGARGRSYLIERDGFLFQSPVSWFTQAGAWDLSPGFASFYPGERVVEPSCLFCHGNRVEPVEQSRNHYHAPVFRGSSGIGCERCHGPGELHVRERRAGVFAAPGGAQGGPTDDSIVNPRDLPPALREAVCQQCHLQGERRFERRGRQTFDYRPGLALHEFWAVFVRGPEQGSTRKAVGHVEQMTASRCFRASRGKMGCISCHNPHELPPADQRVDYYRNRCLECHEGGERPPVRVDGRKRPAAGPCSLQLSVRKERAKGDDCTRCHMPRFPSTNIAHTAVTDHRILRSPRGADPGGGARGAPPPWQGPREDEPPVVNFFQKELRPDDPDASRDLGVALAYLDRSPGPFRERMAALALPLLERATTRRPRDVVAGEARGWSLGALGRTGEALAAYQATLRHAPDRELTLILAAQAAEGLGRDKDALAYRRRLVEQNPQMGEYRIGLGKVLARGRDWGGTLREAEAALRLTPLSKEARMLLVLGCLRTGQPGRAEREVTALIALSPEDAPFLRDWFSQQRLSH